MIVHIYQNPLSYLYEPLFDLKLVIVKFLNEDAHIVIVFKNNLHERKMKKIKIFTNLLIFFKASQCKVVSVCVLVIFHVAVRYKEVDLLVRTSIGNKIGVRCPLFGGVRCLECPLAEVPLYLMNTRICLVD